MIIQGRANNMDLLYLGILALASVATYGLLKACEWLSDNKHRGRP